jgi:hypothetical protein
VEQGVSSQTIIKGLRRASAISVNKIKEIAVNTKDGNKRETLSKLAATAMSSKLIKRNSEFFTKSRLCPLVFLLGSLTLTESSGCRCCVFSRSR